MTPSTNNTTNSADLHVSVVRPVCHLYEGPCNECYYHSTWCGAGWCERGSCRVDNDWEKKSCYEPK